MSNRIEEAIRKILFTRKQHDILLEQIIKQALLEGKTVAKIKDATKAEQQAGKQAGAVVVYAVVMRNVSEQNITKGVFAATNSVGLKDPNKRESKQIDIGPNSIYATTTKEFVLDPINLKQSDVLIRGEYQYFIGNINKTGNRIRCVVWIIPMNLWQQYEQFVHTDEYYKDSGSRFLVDGLSSYSEQFKATIITTMKSWIRRSESRASNPALDKKWYMEKNEGELKPLPPESWYNFAGLPPSKAVALGTDAQTNSDTDQDDIVEVTDKKVGAYTFTGTWNNTKGHPIAGQMKVQHPDGVIVKDGTWTYDTNKDEYWFSQGTKKYPNGDYYTGTFDANKFLDGEYYEIGNPYTNSDSKTVYETTTGYKQNGKIDTTKQFKISLFDSTTKKEIAYYEGTVDENVKQNNGTVWENSTKTKELGKFTNGKFE